jgi:hypothetical protein
MTPDQKTAFNICRASGRESSKSSSRKSHDLLAGVKTTAESRGFDLRILRESLNVSFRCLRYACVRRTRRLVVWFPAYARVQEDETMEELEVAVDALSQHVAMLEGIIDVMLQEAENGTLERAAASIRSALLHGDGD